MKRSRPLLFFALPVLALVVVCALFAGLSQITRTFLLDLYPLAAWIGLSRHFTDLVVWLGSPAAWPFRLLFVMVVLVGTLLLARSSRTIAGWLMASPRLRQLPSAAADSDDFIPSPRRVNTLRDLLASLLTLSAFTLAFFLILAQFVELTSLGVIVTVLSTALGFAMRDYINDLIMGVTNIFEDNFDVGEKVEIRRVGDTIEGIIERATVRALYLRTPTGVLVSVANGEVRILRNYSRGSFSGATLSLYVSSQQLPRVLLVLDELGHQAAADLPELLEPWTVVSPEGQMGSQTELRLICKTRFGQGAHTRLRLMALIESRLAQEGLAMGEGQGDSSGAVAS